MLSAAKIKLHGMSDARWQCKDKISQYRGIVKLFERDAKVLNYDLNVQKRKLKRLLVDTKKAINLDRQALDDAMVGDRQIVSNLLAPFREMKLAYGQDPVQNIIENISHRNFLMRKKRDLIKYATLKEEERMKNAKLYFARLEDIEQFQLNKTPLIIQEECVSGKIQDMILKQDAAIAVGITYKQILDIMKNDDFYIIGVLNTLDQDCINQSKCLQMTVELGQMATEYLDDRKNEFYTLERIIKQSRNERIHSLRTVERSIHLQRANIKNLIRKESDIHIGLKRTKLSENEKLEESINELNEVLNELKSIVRVSNFERIFPCLERQKDQEETLSQLLQISNKHLAKFQHKVHHGFAINEKLKYTMLENTLQYQRTRDDLKKLIKENETKLKNLKGSIAKRADLLSKINMNSERLFQICLPVKTDRGVRITKDPQPVDEQTYTFSLLVQKLTHLVGGTTNIANYTAREQEVAINMYNDLMKLYSYSYEPIVVDEEESLIEDFAILDMNIYTRVSMKAESARIVEENNIDPDLLYVAPKKKR